MTTSPAAGPYRHPHLAVLLLTFALLAGALLAAVASAPNPAARTVAEVPAQLTGTDAGLITTPAAPQLEEDQPGWDCATMGNLTCGPNQ